MNSTFLVSQQELADNFGVDRTTIRAWTKQGLPCIEGDRGKSHQYHPGITMWWRVGAQYAEKMKLRNLTGVQCIALGREYADIDATEHNIDDFVTYIAGIGIGEVEAYAGFYFARGIAAGRGSSVASVQKYRQEFTKNLAHAKV
ncbi:hypothetical protein D8682_17715 [Buttiauxella sp. 3AFRM03]|uniref:hypothetical protein n=1 Tax=Buttiauxella sp. 3AFRM03 TaxID=2479367 RepID=UPI000EF7A76A|nr:hypothetical protein [Buttiauxella sp. 3AFRM03]AYN28651.1 hypothetical protein D8682_17715 [Buttiauxella sp. 3AFRM03]